MTEQILQRMLGVCDEKILHKGANVGLSFYAFFENKNTDPELLMKVARWWILDERLDHFVKAATIKKMVEKMLQGGA
jgi:Family of unknown function (DUF6500)